MRILQLVEHLVDQQGARRPLGIPLPDFSPASVASGSVPSCCNSVVVLFRLFPGRQSQREIGKKNRGASESTGFYDTAQPLAMACRDGEPGQVAPPRLAEIARRRQSARQGMASAVSPAPHNQRSRAGARQRWRPAPADGDAEPAPRPSRRYSERQPGKDVSSGKREDR